MSESKEKKSSLTRKFSAGGTLYRQKKKEIEWLLIKPAGTDRWQLPKGEIESKEKSQDAAVREVFEETGVQGQVIAKIDTIKFFFQQDGTRILKQVTFFLMKYTSGRARVTEESKKEIDEVGWFATKQATDKLTFESEKEIVRKGAKVLQSNRT